MDDFVYFEVVVGWEDGDGVLELFVVEKGVWDLVREWCCFVDFSFSFE